MTIPAFIEELKGLASETLRKEYIRNGAPESVLGLKYTYMQFYKKEFGKNHDMAMKLWETQIPEVQILATMIVDQKQLTSELIEKWNHDIDFYLLSDAFIGNILATYKGRLQLANKWINEEAEYTLRHAYTIIFMLAKENGFIRDHVFAAYLDRIEQNIQDAPNRAKETMLYSILNIGRRNRPLNTRAIEVLEKIGPVNINHGSTGGITPDVLQILKLVRQSEGYIFITPGDMIEPLDLN
jgi:3-methyladenine DNA glycosylase AlkD